MVCQAKSLGTVREFAQRSIKTRRLRRHDEQRALESVENIFNTPATTVSRGRSPDVTPLTNARNTPQRSPTPQRSSMPHTSPSPHHTQPSSPSRHRSPYAPTQSEPRRKRGRSLSRSPSSAPRRKLLKCEYRDGQVPTGRPGARDYEPEVYNLILMAISEYGALIITNDPVPPPEKQVTWATECWNRAGEALEEKYELPDRIVGLVCIHFLFYSILLANVELMFIFADTYTNEQCPSTHQRRCPSKSRGGI